MRPGQRAGNEHGWLRSCELAISACSTDAFVSLNRLWRCPAGGMFGPRRNDPILQARSRESGRHIVFVHPAEFLVTSPNGDVASRTILGDRLAIDPAAAYGPSDSMGVFYFDVPLATPAARGRMASDRPRSP